MRCPCCQCEIPDAHRFCGSCGSPVSAPSQLPTATGPSRPAGQLAALETPARILSSDSIRGFTPGSVLSGRYRVIGLLGRGGMGQVYRADDIKLGTPVALKFLPRALADDPVRRERFLAEVRIARQVAHPNVCRVFDVTGLFIFFPVTGNLRAWYAGAGVTALLVLAALALFGFTTALAGRPALGKAALEE